MACRGPDFLSIQGHCWGPESELKRPVTEALEGGQEGTTWNHKDLMSFAAGNV